MTLNAPSQVLFVISLILAILGLIGYFVPAIAILAAYTFWWVLAGYVVLAAGCLFKGA
jgi:hypothetical protein